MAGTADTLRLDAQLLTDPTRYDSLILVDRHDRQIGCASKEVVHREGLLHRAFSVVLWREGPAGREVLLSRRAACKYHSPGLWANSCCSHPRDGEELLAAAHRRLQEELGCSVEGLHEICSFIYRAFLAEGLVEHEYDHVLLARYDGEVSPNPDESDTVRWISLDALTHELEDASEQYAAWAPRVLEAALEHLQPGRSREYIGTAVTANEI